MKRIPHQCKWDVLAFEQYHQFPEIRMKDRIAACNIEIWFPVIYFTEVLAVGYHLLHLFPGHAL